MAKKFSNSRQTNFLSSLPCCDIETSDIAQRCKFNFSYFDDTQNDGQSFEDWNVTAGVASLVNLMEKIKEFTKEPLSYWKNRRVGGGSLKILENYDKFPTRTTFIHPKYIPHDVIWSRFRLSGAVRLVGFVLPDKYSNVQSSNGEHIYDCNTFYVVFLDREHKFYLTR